MNLLTLALIAGVILGLPTLYFAWRYREYRKFLAGSFFVSAGSSPFHPSFLFSVSLSSPACREYKKRGRWFQRSLSQNILVKTVNPALPDTLRLTGK